MVEAWLGLCGESGGQSHPNREKPAMGKAKVRSVRDLVVWQVGMEISIACYRLSNSFPKEELYGLTSQVRRAAVSIPANIAEGFGRSNPGDYHRHLQIAQGSLKELETLLEIVERLELADGRRITDECDRLGRMMRSLIGKIREAR